MSCPEHTRQDAGGQNGPGVGATSALARLEAAVGLVDDVDAALAAHQAIIAVARAQRLQRIPDLHGRCLLVRTADGGRERDRASDPFHVKIDIGRPKGRQRPEKSGFGKRNPCRNKPRSGREQTMTSNVWPARFWRARARRKVPVASASPLHACASTQHEDRSDMVRQKLFLGGTIVRLGAALGLPGRWPKSAAFRSVQASPTQPQPTAIVPSRRACMALAARAAAGCGRQGWMRSAPRRRALVCRGVRGVQLAGCQDHAGFAGPA